MKVKQEAVTDSRTVAGVHIIERAMLVYQSGIANVFEVECFNLNPFGRNARRLMQHAFRPCEDFTRGLAAAGVIVRTASCNVAGDCADVQWTDGIEGTPFSESCNPVNENNLTADEIAEFAVLFPAD